MSLPKHHAFVAYGSPSRLKEFASYIARELGVSAAGNPDFHIKEYSSDGSSLDVAEARAISELSAMKSTGGLKVFVIGASTINRQAQNAFLKTLEEPSEHTVFAFLVPRGALIDTVKSRVIEIAWSAKSFDDALAEKFLSTSPDARTSLIAGMLKDKDKEGALELVNSVERLLSKNLSRRDVRSGLEELARTRIYLVDASSSMKMILEHLALVLPKH